MVLYGTEALGNQKQAYELLDRAVQEWCNMDTLPEIQRHPHGKPFFPDYPQVEFNLSHSGGLALCALDTGPVGVDIQVVKSWRAGLPRRVCSEQELGWLEGQQDRQAGFAVLWALKECRVKQSGLGLRMQIRDIAVPLPERWEGAVLLDGLQFQVYQGPGWAAAVCGETTPPDGIQWRALV